MTRDNQRPDGGRRDQQGWNNDSLPKSYTKIDHRGVKPDKYPAKGLPLLGSYLTSNEDISESRGLGDAMVMTKYRFYSKFFLDI